MSKSLDNAAKLRVWDSAFRNVLINGDFFVDQRNVAAAQTITAGAVLAYTVDRWYAFCTGANVSGQQITASDATKRYRFTGAASVTGIGFGQRAEAANSLWLAGNICTLSVKLTNTLLTSVSWALYYATSTNSFGTVASPTRTSIASGTFTVSSTETTYSTQVTIPAAATTGLELVLSVGAQTSGTWTIGDAQLELGTIPSGAIVFERVEAGESLRRCQRYYCKTFSQTVKPIQNEGTGIGAIGYVSQATQAFDVTWALPVEMRTAPATVTTYSPNAASSNWSTNIDSPAASIFSAGTRNIVVRSAASGAAGRSYEVHVTADAEL